MKILMFGWEFPPAMTGGLGVACEGIVDALAELSVAVHMVLPKSFTTFCKNSAIQFIHADKPLSKQIDYYYYFGLNPIISHTLLDSLLTPYDDAITFQKKQSGLTNSQQSLPVHKTIYSQNLMAEVLRYAENAAAIAKQYSHDVIHAHDWMTILPAIQAKKISEKPLLLHVHSIESDRAFPVKNQLIQAIEYYGLLQADMVVTVSEYTKNCIIEQYDIPAEKIHVAHNGVPQYCLNSFNDNIQQKKNNKKKTILFLGRITYQKGPKYFIDMAEKLYKIDKSLRFIIAGDGDLLAEMVRWVATKNLGHVIQFLGYLNRENIIKVLKESDVYIMPSVSEPFGITCLEAMSAGVATIISKNAGVAEVVQHVDKFDYWDSNAMAEAALLLIGEELPRLERVRKARLEISPLTWDRTARKLVDIYHKLRLA